MTESPKFLADVTSLPVLETERLRIRPVTMADTDDLFAVFSSPRVMRYWSSPAMRERAEAVAYIQSIFDFFTERSLFQWGIALRADDRLIGTCTLFALDATHRRCEIGYALHDAHWRRGIMSEVLTRLFDFAFDELRIHRIEADVDPRNDASMGLLERLGFRREGYLRERWFVNDEIQDAAFLGLLAPDWRARRSS